MELNVGSNMDEEYATEVGEWICSLFKGLFKGVIIYILIVAAGSALGFGLYFGKGLAILLQQYFGG